MIFLIITGSLAVSVTDMTAPVVGSSGGVYALVSAHLANVVMVSYFICVCICVWMIIISLSCPVTKEHCHIIKAACFRAPAGAVLSTDSIHSTTSVFPFPPQRSEKCVNKRTCLYDSM